jgi:hypothetical protein
MAPTAPPGADVLLGFMKSLNEHAKISKILMWTAVGISSVLGVAALAVALLFKVSTKAKIITILMLGLLIGLAWTAFAVHRTMYEQIAYNRLNKAMKKVGIDLEAIGITLEYVRSLRPSQVD